MAQLTKLTKTRNFTEIKEKQQLNYIVDQYLGNRKVFVKGEPESLSANFEITNSGNNIRLSFPMELPNGIVKKADLTIYTIANRYIEIKLKKTNFDNNIGDFEFVEAKIANDIRNEPRINVEKNNVIAENFRLSKYSVNPHMKTAPICVQHAFDLMRESILQEIPNAILEPFDEKNIKSKDLLAVQKTMKTLYIEDINKESNYESIDPAFLNYKEFLGSKFEQEVDQLKQSEIKSLLVYPIIYVNIMDEKIAVGFLKVSSTTGPLPLNLLPKLYEHSKKIAETIRDANVQIINTPQKVVNISKKGAQILVTDKKVIDTFRANREDLVFNIKPSSTFHIILYAKVINILENEDKTYLVSFNFIGGEERRGLDSWYKYVDNQLINKAEEN